MFERLVTWCLFITLDCVAFSALHSVSGLSEAYALKGQRCQLVTLGHPGLTYIFNFGHSGTLALRAERQSARMSEINNGRLDLDGTEHFEM